MMEFTYFTDSGHGWIKVDRSLLKQLNIENKISHYSYQKNHWCYLEEDCDASELFSALKDHQIDYRLIEKYTDGHSTIRNYARYKDDNAVQNRIPITREMGGFRIDQIMTNTDAEGA